MPLLSDSIVTFLFVEVVIWLMQLTAFIFALQMLRSWDFRSSAASQYRLEKRAYLVILIILITILFKIVLLPFFSYMTDGMASMVPGAMCAAGVIKSNDFGMPLLMVKLAGVMLMGWWLLINREDLKARDYPLFRYKFLLFLIIFALATAEVILDFAYLGSITLEKPVACCSTIYGMADGGGALPMGLDRTRLLLLFYVTYLLVMVSAFYRYAWVAIVANAFFVYIGYYAVVHVFGTYIYELPTHLCPFCMLQPEYFGVGYAIWGSLFAGTFFGMAAALMQWTLHRKTGLLYRYNGVLNTFFVLLCTAYVAVFYLKNGVFLT